MFPETWHQLSQYKIFACVCFGVLLALSLVGSSVVLDNLATQSTDGLPGVPALESPFASLVNQSNETSTGRIISDRPLLIRLFLPSATLGEAQALMIAQDFLEPHLPPNTTLQLENSFLVFSDVGIGYPIPPRWLFIFSNFSLVVDTVTGNILDYENRYARLIDENATATISTEEALTLALTFMTFHNLSIPVSARYLGDVNESYYEVPTSLFQFHHYEDQVKIYHDRIRIGVNLVTGDVIYFGYTWIEVPAFETGMILSARAASSLLFDTLEDPSAYRLSTPVLTLTEVPSPPDSRPTVWVVRLCWVANLYSRAWGSLVADLFSDAYTGEYLGKSVYRGAESPQILNAPFTRWIIGVLVIIIALGIAGITYVILRRRSFS